jgi:hypothetical protein
MISTLEAPGWKWVGFLGGIGFAVGFFGPMIFVPEANQGPMVGIFITGPGGALLGLILTLLMKFLPVSARAQWRLLVGICLVGTVSTLLIVQPEPARLGFIVEIEVTGVRTPAQATDQVVREWKESFVSVTWATPRAGWEAEMRRSLAENGGQVVDALLVRRRWIMERRKLWNRGQIFASDWEKVHEVRSYYMSSAQPVDVRSDQKTQLFVVNDSLGGVSAPDAWPPHEFERIIGLSVVAPVPAAYEAFR